jgi:hypothetical protein
MSGQPWQIWPAHEQAGYQPRGEDVDEEGKHAPPERRQ